MPIPSSKNTPRASRKILDEEEHRFARTVEVGLKKLDEDLVPYLKSTGNARSNSFDLSGDEAFRALRHLWPAARFHRRRAARRWRCDGSG